MQFHFGGRLECGPCLLYVQGESVTQRTLSSRRIGAHSRISPSAISVVAAVFNWQGIVGRNLIITSATYSYRTDVASLQNYVIAVIAE